MRHISTLLLMTSLAAPAMASGPAANESERCRVNADPFVVPAYVFNLPFQLPPQDSGKCVEHRHYRPALLLQDATSYGFDPKPSNRIVANVRHYEEWYVASIPVEAVSSLVFQVSIRPMRGLGTRGAHAQMRVFFDEPVELTPQWPANPAQRFQVSELIFTANPVGVDDASREDPRKNFDGSLLQARGIHTRETRIHDAFVAYFTNTIRQYRLRVSPQEASAYVKRYLEVADAKRLSQRFNLAGINCNSSQFEILDEVLRNRYGQRRIPFDPEHAVERLAERGLIDAESALPAFESEDWAQVVIQAR